MKQDLIYCDSCKKECRKACRPVGTRIICTGCHKFLTIFKELRLADGSKLVIRNKQEIPTTEELFENYSLFCPSRDLIEKEGFIEALKQFAKLHVEAALKAACEKATCSVVPGYQGYKQTVDKVSILNSYSLENIN